MDSALTYHPREITDDEFRAFQKLIKDRFGINLTDQKRSLVVGRLTGILRREGLSSFDELYRLALEDRTGSRLSQLIDRISTNHTHFHRESEHYDYFARVVIPQFLEPNAAKDPPRIWVAGCSSGEEAYNLAMLLQESGVIQGKPRQAVILATDISAAALEKAARGVYSEENVRRLPGFLSNKYFQPEGEDKMRVARSVADLVLFRRLNLIRESFPFRNKFHIIFCRNVMIYFDPPTRARLVDQFHELLEPGGFLFIGHSETISRESRKFDYLRPALFRKAG